MQIRGGPKGDGRTKKPSGTVEPFDGDTSARIGGGEGARK